MMLHDSKCPKGLSVQKLQKQNVRHDKLSKQSGKCNILIRLNIEWKGKDKRNIVWIKPTPEQVKNTVPVSHMSCQNRRKGSCLLGWEFYILSLEKTGIIIAFHHIHNASIRGGRAGGGHRCTEGLP